MSPILKTVKGFRKICGSLKTIGLALAAGTIGCSVLAYPFANVAGFLDDKYRTGKPNHISKPKEDNRDYLEGFTTCGIEGLGFDITDSEYIRSQYKFQKSMVINALAPRYNGHIFLNKNQLYVNSKLVSDDSKFPNKQEINKLIVKKAGPSITNNQANVIFEDFMISSFSESTGISKSILYADLSCYLSSHEVIHALNTQKDTSDSINDMYISRKTYVTNKKIQEYLADHLGVKRAIHYIAKDTNEDNFRKRVEALMKTISIFRYSDSEIYRGTKLAFIQNIEEINSSNFNRSYALEQYSDDTIFAELNKIIDNIDLPMRKDRFSRVTEIDPNYGFSGDLFVKIDLAENVFDKLAFKELSVLNDKAEIINKNVNISCLVDKFRCDNNYKVEDHERNKP